MALTPQPGQILKSNLFSEPMRVEIAIQVGIGTWRLGLVGTLTEKFRSVTLSADQLPLLQFIEPAQSFNGDGSLLRLGLQAHSLGIAFEFDPTSAKRTDENSPAL